MPDQNRSAPGLVRRRMLDFTACGLATRPASEGLCPPEPHHSWALAPVSQISVPACPAARPLYLLIELTPYCGGAGWPALDLLIHADDEPCAALRTERPAVIAVRIDSPRQIANGFTLRFTCQNPVQTAEPPHRAFALHRIHLLEPLPRDQENAASHGARFIATPPAALADAIRGEFGLSVPDLLMRFESLGHNCEFGLAQRQGGADPLGLMRFAGADPHDLARAILLGLDGVGEDLRIYPSPDAAEYLITDMRYAIHCHGGVSLGGTGPESIRRGAQRRLRWLGRKFMEDINSGEKIFLLRLPAPDTSNGMLTLWVVLNLYARNTVLNVTQETESRPRGVSAIGPRQLIGTIDGCPGGRPPSLAAWLYVCAEAYGLREGT